MRFKETELSISALQVPKEVGQYCGNLKKLRQQRKVLSKGPHSELTLLSLLFFLRETATCGYLVKPFKNKAETPLRIISRMCRLLRQKRALHEQR